MSKVLYHKIYKHPSSEEWVTFIHGAGGSSGIWHRQLRAFREHFNLLLIDLRGHGRSKEFSANDDSEYTFPLISKEVMDVLDHHRIRKSHFVGVSLGSIIIRTIAHFYPERVLGMIQSGAILKLDFRTRTLVAIGNLFKHLVPFIWLYKLFARIIMPRKSHYWSRKLFVDEARKMDNNEFLKWFPLAYGLNAYMKKKINPPESVPDLFLMGEEDYLFLPIVKETVKNFANKTLRVVPEAGHVSNVDNAEYFNKIAIDFIKKHSPSLKSSLAFRSSDSFI